MRRRLIAGRVRLNPAGPANEERHAMTAFPEIALDAAPTSHACVPEAADALVSTNRDFTDDFRTVVAREDNNGVLAETVTINGAQDITDHGVSLHHEVAVVARL